MTNMPRVVMASMWRNDCARRLVDRVEHLLAKSESYPALRWVWVVGDSRDDTTQALAELSYGYKVQIVDIGDTGIEGEDAHSRLRRLSETANEYFNWCENADYILVHESDIASPGNIVNRLVAHAGQGRCPIAAWPMLEIAPGRSIFYDTLCYRKDGQQFTHHPPYHADYVPDKPFTVDSFGSVFMFHAEDAPLLRMENRGVLDLCDQLRQQGRTLWVDPTLEVVQPYDLWQPHNTREYAWQKPKMNCART